MGRKPQLLDHRGNPVRARTLTQEVAAATVGGVRSPVAGYPADGLNPVRLSQILRAADMGDPVSYMELAETIEERDLHYLGVIGTRRRQVSQIEVTVEPADDSADALRHAEHIRNWLARDELGDELFDILDAVPKGYSFTEIIWDVSMGQWEPKALERRDQRWFRFDRSDLKTPLMLNEAGQEEPLPGYKFIYAQIKAKSGLPLRSGLSRAAMWAYLFKMFTMRDWAIFSQTYGQPLRLGKYGPGASDEDKDTLFRAVANIGGDMAGIIPNSMVIDFIESGNLSATGQLYKDRCDFLDQQVSKAVLGQTATTDSVTGGLGSGEEHGEVRKDIETADAKALAAVLNRDLGRPMIDLEFGPQKNYPRIKIERVEPEDLVAFAGGITPFIDRGLRVAAQPILDKFGLDAPQNGQDVLSPAQKTAPDAGSGGSDGQSSAVKHHLKGSVVPEADVAAQTPELQSEAPQGRSDAVSVPRQIAESAAEAGNAPMAALLEQVEVMLGKAGSLEELREMILSAYPDLDATGLVDVLGDAMAAAEAAGQIEVAESDA